MSQYHPDERVENAMRTLADALAESEQVAGQKSVLVLLPCGFADTTILVDGKPLNDTAPSDIILALAMGYQGWEDGIAAQLRIMAVDVVG